MDRLRSVGGTALIVLLVVLAVVLVDLAERHTSLSAGAADSAPIQPLHVKTPGTTKSVPVPTSTPTSAPALLLSAFNAEIAMSAYGGCHGQPHLALTSNGGKTFSPLVAPAPHVLRISSIGATSAWLVGANAKCSPTYYSTVDSGKTWSRSTTLPLVWVALPTGVRTPSAGVARPCGATTPRPLALAPSSFTDALVVCTNGIYRTTSGGRSWTAAAALPTGQPVAAALTVGGTGVVLLTGTAKCSGVRVALTANSGAAWTRGSCLKGVTARVGVALTAAGAGLVVGTGRSYASADFGKTWT